MAKVLVPAFGIGGFRSFFDEPQIVGPLSPITVLAGPNNSGKSNILRFATWVLSDAAVGRNPERDRSDMPAGGGVGSERRTVGRVQFVGTDIEAWVRQQNSSNPAYYEGDGFGALRRVLHSPALRSGLESCIVQNLSQGTQQDMLSQDANQAASLASLGPSVIIHATNFLGGNVGMGLGVVTPEQLIRHASNLISLLFENYRPPQVKLVEAERYIRPEISDASNSVKARTRLDGTGIARQLLRLSNPEIDDEERSYSQWAAINNLVRAVTLQPSAQLRVSDEQRRILVSIDGRTLPLTELGSGITQLVLLATFGTVYEDHLLCIEEPEIHMHPLLVRRLIRYLRDHTDNQYLIATHSAHLLDDPAVRVLDVSYSAAHGTEVREAVTDTERSRIAVALGYRASDLLQANCVIWVEGPSDRVYLVAWIAAVDATLIDGIHFTVMFYAGRLLAHLTGADSTDATQDVHTFISLLRINRNMAILIDSDRDRGRRHLNSTKRRVVEEFEKKDAIAWVTDGREIENYIPMAVLKSVLPAAASAHGWFDQEETRYRHAFEGLKTPDKVAIARSCVAGMTEVWNVRDLRSRVTAIVRFIRGANDSGETVPL